MHSALTQFLDSCIEREIFPSASLAFGDSTTCHFLSRGRYTYAQKSQPVDADSVYDLASLTKVIATTSLTRIAEQRNLLDLERPVRDYWPEFVNKDEITVRHLLTHSSGLTAHRLYQKVAKSPEEAWEMVGRERLIYEPDTKSLYSCVGFLSLFRVLNNAFAQPFDHAARRFIFEPLGMHSTGHNAVTWPGRRCVPTEIDPETHSPWVGVVHDENSRFFGGVSGNAGLFGTARDLAKFAQALISETLPFDLDSRWKTPFADWTTRAFGWDTKSPEGSMAGSRFGPKSFGHSGFTGTSMWFDPDAGIWAVILTNWVYPKRGNPNIEGIRAKIHDLIFAALR